MSSYNRRDVLKMGTGATLIAGGILAGGTVGADDAAERRDVQAPSEPVTERPDGFDGDALEHVWEFRMHHMGVVVADDTVYTTEATLDDRTGTYTDEGMIALDGEDGSVLWKNEAAWSVPKLLDGRLYASDSGQFYALDRTDGSLRWQADLEIDGPGRGTYWPAADDDHVYTSTHETLFAFDVDDGSTRWQVDIETDDPHSPPTPVVAHDAVFLNVSGVLYAIEADDGSVRWQKTVGSRGSRGFNGTPVVDDDHVYISREPAFAFDPETGEEAWSIFHDMDTSIEVSAKALARKDGYSTEIYDLETREEIASVPDRDPFILGDEIAITAQDDPEEVVAIDLGSGDVLWRVPSTYTTPEIVGDTVIFQNRKKGVDNNLIVALNKYDGTKRWEVEANEDDFSRFVIGDEMIVTNSGETIQVYRETAAETDDGSKDDCECDENDDGDSEDTGSDSDDGDETGNTDGGSEDGESDGDSDDTETGSEGDSANVDANDESGDAGNGAGDDPDETDDNESSEDADEAENGSDGSEDDDSEETPGFGVVTGLAGAVGGGALAARRFVSSDDLTDGD